MSLFILGFCTHWKKVNLSLLAEGSALFSKGAISARGSRDRVVWFKSWQQDLGSYFIISMFGKRKSVLTIEQFVGLGRILDFKFLEMLMMPRVIVEEWELQVSFTSTRLADPVPWISEPRIFVIQRQGFEFEFFCEHSMQLEIA